MFLFFSLLGVLGSYLPVHPTPCSGICCCPPHRLRPAGDRRAPGINNVRDIETDAASGKITLAVRAHHRTAPSPITGELGAALLATVAFLLTQPASLWPWIFLPAMKPSPMPPAPCARASMGGVDRRPQEDRHQRLPQPAAPIGLALS